jgi:meso-butanediol dehydrogenase / (S,S)-butanediol dehydrogenase / diacetyl reductase
LPAIKDEDTTMQRLAGRVAVVTGAGAGIGAAIARQFAEEGAHVIVNDLSLEVAQAAASQIQGAGGAATACGGDVTKPADTTPLLDAIKTQHGKLYILVNNAGLNVRGDFRHMTDDDWRKIRDTNLDSAVRLSRDALPLLQAAGNASILNIASIMATRHLRQLAAYSVTKAAIAGLSRALAVEYAAFGVRVNYLCPGFVETALTERVLRMPPLRKALIDQTPMRRFGTPEDMAKAALFLVSDDAAFITGAGLTVDGGMSIGL